MYPNFKTSLSLFFLLIPVSTCEAPIRSTMWDSFFTFLHRTILLINLATDVIAAAAGVSSVHASFGGCSFFREMRRAYALSLRQIYQSSFLS